MFRITASRENYLKAIYSLDPMGAGTRVADIASALSVSKASVSRMVSRLEKEGFAERFGKNRIGLTEEGRRRAREVKSHYEVIRLYLVEILRVDYKTANGDACALEHVLSGPTLAAMRQAVANSDDWATLAQMLPA